MMADPAAKGVLTSAYVDQLHFRDFRREELEAVEAVRDRLACLLDKPSCRDAKATP